MSCNDGTKTGRMSCSEPNLSNLPGDYYAPLAEGEDGITVVPIQAGEITAERIELPDDEPVGPHGPAAGYVKPVAQVCPWDGQWCSDCVCRPYGCIACG